MNAPAAHASLLTSYPALAKRNASRYVRDMNWLCGDPVPVQIQFLIHQGVRALAAESLLSYRVDPVEGTCSRCTIRPYSVHYRTSRHIEYSAIGGIVRESYSSSSISHGLARVGWSAAADLDVLGHCAIDDCGREIDRRAAARLREGEIRPRNADDEVRHIVE